MLRSTHRGFKETAGAKSRPAAGEPIDGPPQRVCERGRLRVPVYVQTTTPFQALELELTPDSLEVRVVTARLARSAQGALVRFDSDAAGRVKVALASAAPIGGDAAPVLHLELEPLDGHARGRIELRRALVDDRPAEME